MYSEPELHITHAHESNNFLVEWRHQEMIVSIYLHWTVHTFFISHVLIPSGLNGKMIQAQEREWMCPCQSDGPGPGDACWRNADAVMLWQKMGGVAPPTPRFSDDCSSFHINGRRLSLVHTLCFSLWKHPSSKLPVLSCRRSSAICFSAVCFSVAAEPWECCQVKQALPCLWWMVSFRFENFIGVCTCAYCLLDSL